jgi:hypothetical protein
MPNLRSVSRPEWLEFFDRMSRGLLGRWAEIEMASLQLGNQLVAEWVPLLGITYDFHADIIDIALDRTNHMIAHPRDVEVDETPRGLASVAILDEQGTRQVLRLREPLQLPAKARSLSDQRNPSDGA